MHDSKYSFDFSKYPQHFQTLNEALDTYNSVGYGNKIQFRLYEHKRSPDTDPSTGEPKTLFFSLACYLRNMPKYDTKYYQYD